MGSEPRKASGNRRDEPLHELTFGGRRPSPTERAVVAHGPSGPAAALDELQARCRSKAEAALLVVEHRRRPQSPFDVGSLSPDFATWAERLLDTSYWLEAGSSESDSIAMLDDLAGCFEVVAEAIALVEDCEIHQKRLDSVLPLLAEAQSALRQAIARFNIPEDPDQLSAYEAVRQLSARHRIFLRHFMRVNDLANPSDWPAVRSRIQSLSGTDQSAQWKHRQIDRGRKLQHSIRQGSDLLNDWRSLIAIVDELVASGVPPSDRDLRNLVLPIIDDLPELDDPPAGFRRVLREVDRFLSNTTTHDENPGRTSEPTPEVTEVARLLHGQSIALIGGDRRPQAQEALALAFGLNELIWIETKEHEAVTAFEPAIARPDVALVLLAIRWSSHAFSDVKRICDRLDTPFVRLPGGYHPNQVALQILAQCGDRLKNRARFSQPPHSPDPTEA